ncbi:hypothetical protein [Streptosporangium album]|uniref:hypothetical protein n=1 Tax=Streptosporangium album TaxID=47479 RepID=UPI003CD0A587
MVVSRSAAIASPQCDAGGDEPLGMFFVDRLARYSERLGDLRPAPARPHGLLDSGVLHLIGQAPQRRNSRQPIGGILGSGNLNTGHVSNPC